MMRIACGVDLDSPGSIRRLVLVGCLTLYLFNCFSAIDLPPINLIFLMPANDPIAAANYTAPAIIVALNRIREQLILPSGTDIRWIVSETLRSPMLTANNFQKVYTDENGTISAIFGGFCHDVCNILTSISAALNVSYVGVDCNIDTMRERRHARPSTFVTMSYWRPSLAPLFDFLMDRFEWRRVAVLATPDEQSSYYGRTIKKSVESHENYTAFLMLCTFNETGNTTTFTKEVETILDDLTKQARVFFFAMEAHIAARILIVARSKGMYNGDYAFIGNRLEWVRTALIGTDQGGWESAKEGLITLEPSYIQHDRRFIHLVNDVSRVDPRLAGIALQYLTDPERRWEYLAKDLYSAILLFAFSLNKTIAKSDDSTRTSAIHNGSVVMAQARRMTFIGLPDTVYFDEEAVRRADWSIKNLQKNGESIVLVDADKDMKIMRTEEDMDKVTWPGGGHTVPLDHPKCGWDNEKCKTNTDWIFPLIYAIVGLLVLICILLGFFLWRRMKIRREKRTLEEWQVKWYRVTVIGDNIVGRLSVQEAYKKKMNNEVSGQTDNSETLSSTKGTGHRLFTLAGFYKGKTVAIKKVHRESVDVYQATIYDELKQLFYIRHENVNPFIGICSEAPNVCVLMLYADRGSLQDVLSEPKYDINWEFRGCLAMDIVQGMEYLHESPVGPHGHLTSSNCVIDRKWECRITDYGLKQFKRTKNQEITTFKWNFDLMWTAPEILRKPDTDRSRIYGTKEGDVYSFGIIVSEIITKEMPYHVLLESITPEELVRSLKEGEPRRPVLPSSEDSINVLWNQLAAVCWHHQPHVRPTFKGVRSRLKRIVGGKTPNLMHRMQNVLHEGLDRKKSEIAAERRKTETIFYSQLPKFVAEDIFAGNEVLPQRLDSVTICLCETTGIFSAKSLSPIQISDLLNSLFSIYGGIMEKYNVTELSSRGTRELMLLGSGLPLHTDRHADDICDLSLDLIREASEFKTPLTPKFSAGLKISVHTGEVIAAVMGDTIPRYYVVGDAVQTVTDIHGTSKAFGTRISETTYEQIRQSDSYITKPGETLTLKDLSTLKTFWLFRKSDLKRISASFSKRKRRSSPVAKATDS